MGGYQHITLLVFVIIGAVLIAAFSGYAAQAETKEVVAAVDRDFYPEYQINAEGRPEGFAIDMMNEVAKRVGLSVTYRVFETWSDVVAALEGGDADVIPVLSVTRARQGRMLFTRPVVTSSASVFIRQDADDVRRVSDLAGRRVAVIEGGFSAEVLSESIPNARLVHYERPKHALFDLLLDEVDALVSFQSAIWKVGERSRVADRIKLVGDPLTEVKRAIAVRRDLPALRDRLDAALAEFLYSSEYSRFYSEWYSAEPSFWTAGRTGWIAGASTAVLLLGMLLWQALSLRAETRQRVETAPENVSGERGVVKSPAPLVPRTCGFIALALGLAVLFGWAFDLTELKSVLPRQAAMQPWTAITIALAGGALLMATVPKRIAAAISIALAGAVMINGLQALLQHATGFEFGIDRLFFAQAVGNQPAYPYPGRPAEATSIAFAFFGAMLLLARVERAWAHRVFSTTGTVGLVLMAAVLVGYLIGIGTLQSAAFLSPVALPTALGLAVLFLGALALPRDTGWMALISGDGPGAASARMLLPVTILGPLLLVWLFAVGEKVGLYGLEFQIGLNALATMGLLTTSLLWSAARVDRLHRARQAAAEALRQDIAKRKRAEVALANYGHRQAAIADFGQIALSEVDLDTLFSKAVVLVRDQLRAARVAIIEELFDTQEELIRAETSLDKAVPSPGDNGVVLAHWHRTGHATAADPPFHDGEVDAVRLHERATVAKAVISGGARPFGALLALDVSSRQFSENDTAFLQSIANMLAAAIGRKRAEQNIQQLALRDSLTDLPNRSLFRNELHQELARASRYQRMLAVLLLDLDHFKDVNDTLGHPLGDRLLVAAAGRLRACLRETDTPARLGGDEFAVILPDLRSPEDAAFVARKLARHLSEPFLVDGHEIHIGASIGITISPSDAADVDGLLKTADLALYRAKMEGRSTYKLYATYMGAQVETRKTLENDLRNALKRDELFLEYQPQFDLATNQLSGAEALLRWQHPTKGLLPPDDFVPIAEATGLIIPLGRWVLERVAVDMREWRAIQLPAIPIAVNVSLSQCRRGDLVETIQEIFSSTAWSLDQLELEVTEQLFLAQDMGDCIGTLRRLSNLGVTISIDDFGTGYSSLGRLQRLPVDKVKIDKSFVADLGNNRDAEKIVRAIIALATSLGITVIAEGVEHDLQLTFLKTEGCHYAQGYHLSVPLSQHEFAAMLGATSTAPVRSQAVGMHRFPFTAL